MVVIKLTKRIHRHTHYTYLVKNARKVPGGIEVQIEYRNGITSPWYMMDCKYYWVGSKKRGIRDITDGMCDMLVNQGARVRIPSIDKNKITELKKEQKNIRRNRP